MSLSPSQINTKKQAKPATSEPLTLSQALLITAGLAGLIGLCSGAFIRFSLANSPEASFLSPLQTFPALSNWTPELPTETTDAPYASGEYSEYEGDRPQQYSEADSTILTFEPAEPIEAAQTNPIGESLDTAISNDTGPVNITTFDAFANREKGRQRNADPLDLLQKGPNIALPRQSDLEQSDLERSNSQRDNTQFYNENTQNDIYDDSERYDRGYDAGGYNDGYYEENYYPPVEEPIDRNNAYYDDSDRWSSNLTQAKGFKAAHSALVTSMDCQEVADLPIRTH